jgi:hypothetical protein
MKKIYSFVIVTIIALTANAQLVINENFTNYTNGDLGTQGGWVPGTGTPDVQVNNANQLYYAGYPSGTKYVSVTNADGKDPIKNFSATIPTNTNRFIFMSFVVRVSAATITSTNDPYSISLQNTANSFFLARFYIAKNTTNTALQFGISVGSEAPAYTNDIYQLNTTYLIVIRYDVVSGNNNDNVYMWVNPSLASEPASGSANAFHTNSSGEGNYGNTLNALRITQSGTSSPVADFDAFRVSHGPTSLDAWNNLSPAGASLPVVLTSFNAAAEGLNTKLVWNTEEELNIASYVVEKSADGRTYNTIGSVKATNQKTYSFVDGQPGSDNSYYRLKMVDIDGSFKYSYIVSIKSRLNMNISLSPNPVKNLLMIQHPKVVSDGHIQIINANGQLLKDVRLSANAVISNVDMSGFTSGFYHVVFRNGADVFSKTVIKQ